MSRKLPLMLRFLQKRQVISHTHLPGMILIQTATWPDRPSRSVCIDYRYYLFTETAAAAKALRIAKPGGAGKPGSGLGGGGGAGGSKKGGGGGKFTWGSIFYNGAEHGKHMRLSCPMLTHADSALVVLMQETMPRGSSIETIPTTTLTRSRW